MLEPVFFLEAVPHRCALEPKPTHLLLVHLVNPVDQAERVFNLLVPLRR